MADDADDWDEEEGIAQLNEVKGRVREKRTELARTIRALRSKRRTPEQIRAVLDRSKRLIYRSLLIRRRLEHHFRVH